METNKILQADYLDILFDNRNKQYGSYALRKYQDKRMVQAFAWLTGVILAFGIWTFAGNEEDAILEKFDKPHTIYCPMTPDVPPPIPEPPTPPEPTAAKPTIQNTVPTIAPDDIVIAAPTPVDSFAGRESGPANNAGTTGGTVVATTTKTGNGTAPIAPPAPVVVDYSEVMPSFDVDIYAYLNKTLKYPRQAVLTGVEGRVIVQFIVNEDGRISHAKVVRGIGGGCDEEALRVVSAMPAWKPGMQNGKAVKVNFKLPVNFKLQ
ncbi:MAG TPA: energy transducer TonB [Flavipsychrobacter sp.]